MQRVWPINSPAARVATSLSRRSRTGPRLPNISFMYVSSVVIIVLVALPILYLALRALGAGAEGLDYLMRERTLRIVWNSVKLVAAVSITATLIGVPFAWLTARTDLPLRRFWLVSGLLTMAAPSYLGAGALIAAFGPRGFLQSWLAPFGVDRLPEIYGFAGAWIAVTLFTFPYVVLPVRAALVHMDPALEEAARSLGLRRRDIFFKVTLPQLRPAVAAGMLMSALYALSDFGAVALMRYNVFTRAIYLQYNNSFNRERAALLAFVLVTMTLILLTLVKRYTRTTTNYRAGVGAQRRLQIVPLGIWRWPALIFCALVVGIGLGVPVAALAYWLTDRVMVDTVSISPTTLTANAVGLSFISAIVISLIGIPLAALAVRHDSRMSRWMVNIAYIGNGLPGIVIGLALVFFGIRYLPGLYQTIPLLIMGYAIRFLPYSVGATRSALSQINPCYEEAARSLGLGQFAVIRRVSAPLLRTGLIAGGALVFLNVIKELPTTLMLSPIGLRTLATRIWSVYNEGMLALVGAPGLTLIVLAGISLWILLRYDERAH